MPLWESVPTLRKIEFFLTLVVMTVPLAGGAALLSLRHRIKLLLDQTSHGEGVLYRGNVESLEAKNERIRHELESARHEIGTLRRVTAPRQITETQEAILLEKLRGVKAAPVTVAGYVYEEESKTYAEQIAAVLKKAGWDVVLSNASMNDFKGVSVGTVNLMKRPVPGLRELLDAFSSAHVEARQREMAPESIAGSLQDGSLLVVVGRK